MISTPRFTVQCDDGIRHRGGLAQAIPDRGSRLVQSFVQRAAEDQETQCGRDNHDDVVIQLVDLDDVLVHQLAVRPVKSIVAESAPSPSAARTYAGG